MGFGQKINWRLNLLRKAVSSWSEADWVGVFKEILSPHKPRIYPLPRLLDKDENFALYQIGEQKVFFPRSFDPSFLGLVYEEVFVLRVYEHGECRVRPGDWVVDAGACEGLFSLYALQKGANVLAFEPVPELARSLEKTLQEFIKLGRAKVFQAALGAKTEEKTLRIVNPNVGSSTVREEICCTNGEVMRKERILMTSIDVMTKEGALPEVSFIKADVEGSERDLLLGAKEVIRHYRPRLAICTYHLPDDWKVIPKLIRSMGVNYKLKFKGGFFQHLCAW